MELLTINLIIERIHSISSISFTFSLFLMSFENIELYLLIYLWPLQIFESSFGPKKSCSPTKISILLSVIECIIIINLVQNIEILLSKVNYNKNTKYFLAFLIFFWKSSKSFNYFSPKSSPTYISYKQIFCLISASVISAARFVWWENFKLIF